MKNKTKPQQILEKVDKLTYSNTSSNELLSFATEACSTFSGQETIDTKSKFKDQIIQIRDKQIRPLFNEDLLAEEKKAMFSNAKESLTLLLKEYLKTT